MRKFFLEDNVTEQDLKDNGFIVYTGGICEFAYINGDEDDALFIALNRNARPSDKVEVRQIIWNKHGRQHKIDSTVYKLVNSRLFKIVVEDLNEEQIEYIRDNHMDTLRDVIDTEVDNALIYTDDIWRILEQLYEPMDLLKGNVRLDNLLEDLHNQFMEDKDIYAQVYDCLYEQDQKEIDDLAD